MPIVFCVDSNDYSLDAKRTDENPKNKQHVDNLRKIMHKEVAVGHYKLFMKRVYSTLNGCINTNRRVVLC